MASQDRFFVMTDELQKEGGPFATKAEAQAWGKKQMWRDDMGRSLWVYERVGAGYKKVSNQNAVQPLRSQLIRLAHAKPELRGMLLPLLGTPKKASQSKTALRYKGPWSAKLKDMFFEGITSDIQKIVPYDMQRKVPELSLWASAFYYGWEHKKPKMAAIVQKFARVNGIKILAESDLDSTKYGLRGIESLAKYSDFENAAEMLGTLIRFGDLTLAQKFEPYIEEFLPVKEVKLSPTKQFLSWLTPEVQTLVKQVWGELGNKQDAILFAGALCEDVNWHQAPLPTNGVRETPTSVSEVAAALSWGVGDAAAFSYALLILAGETRAANIVKRAALDQLFD